jgi:hypothetical protein
MNHYGPLENMQVCFTLMPESTYSICNGCLQLVSSVLGSWLSESHAAMGPTIIHEVALEVLMSVAMWTREEATAIFNRHYGC